jgi:CRISPR system Cascade subunit CasE
MYLSQLVLDPKARCVLDDLANPYQLHRTLMSAFPAELPADERVLFRVERQHRQPYLAVLVQSHTCPEWDGLNQKGYLLLPAAVKEFQLMPRLNQVFRFRLLANPTRRLKADHKGDGKQDGPRIGLTRVEDQIAWLDRKGEMHGFRVLNVQTVKEAQPESWKHEAGKNHRISHQAVRFDGTLQVTDLGAFSKALENGIGSGKGFGFGLLSLA